MDRLQSFTGPFGGDQEFAGRVAAQRHASLADLEVWCRGGADYGDEVALTLALSRAAGASA